MCNVYTQYTTHTYRCSWYIQKNKRKLKMLFTKHQRNSYSVALNETLREIFCDEPKPINY